jgi:cysteine-rich repeat protein
VCGDGHVAGTEQCDDGNGVDGDGCDNNCKTTACGNGVITAGETCDDGNTTNGDGCDSNCKPTACGNGVVTTSTGEQCDDGNTVSGDGCSSTCQVEGIDPEVEPNDTTAQADVNSVQITGDRTLVASLSSATDVDTFRITVAVGTAVKIDTLTALSPPDCVGGTTDVKLLDSTGTLIISDTGAASSAMGYGGIGACGGVVLYLAPGTYYAQVVNTAAVPTYFLVVDFMDNDGAESEAAATTGTNDTQLTASTNFGASASAFVFGDHVLNVDGDWYAISVPNNAKIRAEIIEGDRATETCESLGIDSRLTLYDQTGTQLADDDDDGRGYCSLIDGLGTTPHDAPAKNSSGASQTYFVQVRASTFAQTVTDVAGQFVYRLAVTVR